MKHTEQPNIVINNTNANTNTNNNNNINAAMLGIRVKNKWVSFFLCLFLGYFGAHKFYEGKIGMGLLYLFTFGLFSIGWFIDCIVLLFKPNPYYVR
jgi:restriction system protein